MYHCVFSHREKRTQVCLCFKSHVVKFDREEKLFILAAEKIIIIFKSQFFVIASYSFAKLSTISKS